MYTTFMLKILVLSGHTSPEGDISVRSAQAVTTALKQAGHSVQLRDVTQTIDQQTYAEADIIFPVIHGTGGEDGMLQKQLELSGFYNFVGSGSISSKLCFNKWEYRSFLGKNGIVVPAGAFISAGQLKDHPFSKSSFVLKPFNGGSSVDTFIVRDLANADFNAMEAALQRHGNMLLETLIDGTEITVGVLNGTALPVIEIIPPTDGEFDYENKYNGKTQELCPPQNVSSALQIQAQDLAVRIHALCECRDLSRTDIMISTGGELFVLETNTIPGMTNQSLFPKAAATAGTNMAALCDALVQAAAQRR